MKLPNLKCLLFGHDWSDTYNRRQAPFPPALLFAPIVAILSIALDLHVADRCCKRCGKEEAVPE